MEQLNLLPADEASRHDALREAEHELADLIARGDEVSWPAVARVMETVESKELWKAEYNSFSAWLRHMAAKAGVQESLLWQRKKALKVWRQHEQKERAAGRETPEVEESGLSAFALVTVEKVANGNDQRASEWISSLQEGRVSQKDLRAALRQARAAGIKPKKTRPDHEKADEESDAIQAPDVETAATAAAVLEALSKWKDHWLFGIETAEEREKRLVDRRGRKFLYKDNEAFAVLPEFPVRVEAAERPRRIDALAVCLENLTEEDWMRCTLRGIEIKVDEHDLRRDQKAGDYAAFVDYLYLAVTSDLVAAAEEVADPSWGIIAWDGEQLRLHREPERQDAPLREEAAMTAIVKLICKR